MELITVEKDPIDPVAIITTEATKNPEINLAEEITNLINHFQGLLKKLTDGATDNLGIICGDIAKLVMYFEGLFLKPDANTSLPNAPELKCSEINDFVQAIKKEIGDLFERIAEEKIAEKIADLRNKHFFGLINNIAAMLYAKHSELLHKKLLIVDPLPSEESID